ncbi:hypothetical protein HDV63DRAFT_415929 [Trichoderma sp. SZMC 28014]
MKLLDTFILPAALLTSVFAMSIPDAQKMGAENMEVENSENICRPRLTSCKADKECCSRACIKHLKIKVCK